MLKEYHVLIAQLEHQYLNRNLTLLRAWYYVQPSLRTMERWVLHLSVRFAMPTNFLFLGRGGGGSLRCLPIHGFLLSVPVDCHERFWCQELCPDPRCTRSNSFPLGSIESPGRQGMLWEVWTISNTLIHKVLHRTYRCTASSFSQSCNWTHILVFLPNIRNPAKCIVQPNE